MKHCKDGNAKRQHVRKKLAFEVFMNRLLLERLVIKVKLIHGRLKVTRSKQQSYADLHRRKLEFQVGDKVFL